MNRWLLVFLGVLAGAALSVQADLLLDGSFEDTGSLAWTAPAPGDPDYTVDFDSSADARTGSESLLVTWSANVDQWTGAFAEQFFPVVAGNPYHTEVYAKVTVPFVGAEAYLETIFRDDSGSEVGAHLQSSKLGSSTVDWTQLSNSGTVPVGATTSQFRLVTFCVGDGGSDQGTIYWDDAYAQIPEPFTSTLLCLGLGGFLLIRRKRTANR